MSDSIGNHIVNSLSELAHIGTVATNQFKGDERITSRKGGYYRCNACQVDFTVRTGTIFERSTQ